MYCCDPSSLTIRKEHGTGNMVLTKYVDLRERKYQENGEN